MTLTLKSIDQILTTRRILITCGTGGVGKTTVSAALAIRAAMLGKNAVVITIDPAKRLATSLGLQALADRPVDLTARLRQAAAQTPDAAPIRGSFSAVMPGASRNFEDFLHDLSPSHNLAERIAKNPIFQIFAKEFSGTNEYMALERLQALDRTKQFDCIILDTPPSRNALAFLAAPKLVAQLFEERLIRWVVLPTNKLLAAGMKKVIATLERLTGAGFMSNLFDFAAMLFEVRVKFLANFERTTALLESPAVGFVIVTTPNPDSAAEIQNFVRTLDSHHFHFEGLAINRTWSPLKDGSDPAPPESPASLVIQALKKRERKIIDLLAQGTTPVCVQIPELARDVHSVEDLYHVASALDSASHL